jgi:hypothetical protein
MRTLLLAALVGLMVACKSERDPEDEDPNGGGDSTSAEDGGPTQSGSGNTTGASGSVDLDTACDGACEEMEACLGDVTACSGSCAQANGECSWALVSYLECISDGPGLVCIDKPWCDAELQAWLDCEAWCTGSPTCWNDDEGCGCSESSCGPRSEYTVDCVAYPPVGYTCRCYADDAFMGDCLQTTEACPTTAVTSCCAALFFVPGG